jgi:Mn-dependent DtxR family transcriptional regulator
MGVSEEVAAEDACKIEHVISDESFKCLKEHLKSSHDLNIIE